MSEAEQPRVLTASVADIRYFATLLKGVNFANRASVSIASDGLSVAVEEDRSLAATAFVFSHVFDEYIYNPEAAQATQEPEPSQEEIEEMSTVFEIPLNTLLECLNIFGTAGLAVSKKKNGNDDDDISGLPRRRDKGKGRADEGNSRLDQWFAPGKGTGMRMSYPGPGHPLTLLIAEEAGGPTATCEISTWEAEPRFELPVDPHKVVLKIILKSSWLRDALSELDSTTTQLTIIGNPPPTGNRVPRNAPPRLRLRAVGQHGSTEMDYPNDREVLETCECPQAVSFTYKYSYITRAQRALQSSLKTSLRIDEDGLLSLQFIMPSARRVAGKRSQVFVDFACLPLDDD
ncbi:Rad1-domain-containing protein [Daedaleopsis nitida]|nr:Rad1-domain-containing protein [Daedaleopsis nitida]